MLTSSNTCHIKIDIISISHYICLDIRIKDPKNLTDQGNSFVSYRWLTWIMICRILDISRYRSISCITHITLFQNLWQISFAFASWNKLLIKLTLAKSQARQIWNLYTIKLANSFCKWVLRGWKCMDCLNPYICLGLKFLGSHGSTDLVASSK